MGSQGQAGGASRCLLLLVTGGADAAAATGAPGWVAGGDLVVLAGQPAATAASLLTGVSARVHGVDRHHPALDYPGPTLTELLRAAGWHTGLLSDDPAVTRAHGFARGCDAFEGPSAGGGDPVTTCARWLERRSRGATGYCGVVWQTGAAARAAVREHHGCDTLTALVDCLERQAALDATLVVALTLPHRALGRAPRWPDFLPASLAVRPPAGDPPVRLTPGPAGPADLLPTVLALLGVEPPPGLPAQGRSLVAGRAAAAAEQCPVVLDQLRDHDLELEWTVGVDPGWAYTRLAERAEGPPRLLARARWRRLGASLARPALRLPLAAIRHGAYFESTRRRAGSAAPDAAPASAFDHAVERWQAECTVVHEAATRWGDDDDEQTLRHRLRGLGYLG